MQTGHWLNVSRDITLTTQILGLVAVVFLSIPFMILIGLSAAVMYVFT